MRGVCVSVAALVSLGIAGSALGGILNGGFETGDLTDWSAVGASQAVTDEFVRDPLGGAAFVPAGDFWLPFAQPGDTDYFASVWSTDGVATWSEISQSFAGVAGETLRFRYFMDFGEDDSGFSDRLYGFLDHPTLGTASFFDVTRSDEENYDWFLVTYVLPETGFYTLRFGAIDGTDSFESVLGIDNVGLDVTIPLPTAGALGGLGLIAIGSRRRRDAGR